MKRSSTVELRLLVLLALIFLLNTQGYSQTDSLIFPEKAKLSETFKKAIEKKTSEYNRLFHKDSATTKHYSAQFMLDKIDNCQDYEYVFLAEYWVAFHYSEIIPDLIRRITNKKQVGLCNSADLIIWERLESGDLKNFYGHGGISKDDLFTIAGRANRLLTGITGEDFGAVSMYSTQEELEALQERWIQWLKQLQ